MSTMWALFACAQADTPFSWRDPCSFPASRSFDLNGDSIMDITTSGHVVGTDDEPSSGGHCTWGLVCLAGTAVLHTNDRFGPREPHAYTGHQALTAEDLEVGIRTQQLAWANGMIAVVEWGYGSAGGRPRAVDPRIGEQVFVLRTVQEEGVWLTSIRLLLDPTDHTINVVVVGKVKAGASLKLQ